MTKKKKPWERMSPRAEAELHRRGRSWKQWTERQRQLHEANPHVAAHAAAQEAAAELGRLIEGRRRQIARRAEEVARRLSEPVVLPDWLDEMLTECREEFTKREIEALVYTYGYALSQREAARALDIGREAFRRRLERAQAKVAHLRGDELIWKELNDDPIDPERYADYLWPMIRRQQYLETRLDVLGAKPE